MRSSILRMFGHLDKSTKIRLNYIVGGTISIILFWSLYMQVKGQLQQLNHINPQSIWQTGPMYFLWLTILLMPVNLLLEARKWHLLAGSAQPLTFWSALKSSLAGLAFSLITPNRIGEYPGRILYLKRQNTFRLISVSILGAIAQLLALFIFGFASLVYYNIAFPGPVAVIGLVACGLVAIGIATLYARFEHWLPLTAKIKWLRRFNIYGQLLQRFSARQQLTILLISMLRFSIYTAQYLFLLYWMNVLLPPLDGYFMSALFFWVMAVIPTIALAELGERGQVSLWLFGSFSENVIGILSATIGLWCINLILPAIAGSLLLLFRRYYR